jgi:hypothetical protein
VKYPTPCPRSDPDPPCAANEWREGLVCRTGKGIPIVSADSLTLPHSILTFHRWYNVPPDETDSESDVEGEQVKGIEETAPEAVDEAVQEDNIQLPAQNTPPSGLAGTSDGHQVAQIQSVDSSASLHAAATSGVPIRDYAFQKAKEASYALGYWTAIYELQSQKV